MWLKNCQCLRFVEVRVFDKSGWRVSEKNLQQFFIMALSQAPELLKAQHYPL